MRIVVIGGSGHIGSFLVPRLVRAGHHVVNVTRGQSAAYTDGPEWSNVERVTADREQEDRGGAFGRRIAALGADAVVDLVCFTEDSARALVDALRGATGHLVHCGSIWRHGLAHQAPITEDTGSGAPFGDYGVRKAAIVRLLKDETAGGGLVTTSLHPGHIVGPGWMPVGPLGNFNPEVWRLLASGQTLRAPGGGTELLNHVHADDVAQAFERAVDRRDAAAGEDFDIVAPAALNVRGYAAAAASWFGQKAQLEQVGWAEFRRTTAEDHAEASWQHLSRSLACSIAKAETALGYAPAYDSLAAVREAIIWLVDHGRLDVPRPA